MRSSASATSRDHTSAASWARLLTVDGARQDERERVCSGEEKERKFVQKMKECQSGVAWSERVFLNVKEWLMEFEEA